MNSTQLRNLFWIIFIPLSYVWWFATYLRRRVRKASTQIDTPVLCVGNIHSGGSGKTPLVCEIGQQLGDAAILSRGYRGLNEETIAHVDLTHTNGAQYYGDEPWMMAHLVNAPIYVGKDRAKSAQELARFVQPKFIILDDGFQHLQLKRNIDLVAINTAESPQNSFCLPAGNLREPLSALRKASAIILTEGEPGDYSLKWQEILGSLCPQTPIFRATRKIQGIYQGKKAVSLSRETPVSAFSGIAAPERFLSDLKSQFSQVHWICTFPDHHSYTKQDIEVIVEQNKKRGEHPIITTDKDWFKVKPLFESHGIPLCSLRISYALEEAFWKWLRDRSSTSAV